MTILYSILEHPEPMRQLAEAGVTRGDVQRALDELEADAEESPADFDPIAPEPVKSPKGRRSVTRSSIYRTVVSGLKNSRVRVDKQGYFTFPAKTTGVLTRKLRELNPSDSYPERRQDLSEMITRALNRYFLIGARRHRSAGKKAGRISRDFHPSLGAARHTPLGEHSVNM